MTRIGADWRLVDDVVTAWFDARSLTVGAALAARILDLPAEVDVRSTGLRVRLDSAAHTEAVSTAARDLGLTANPAALQQLTVVLEAADPSAVSPFWDRVLGGPGLRIRPSSESRPLRNRIHLDVVRPAAAVAQADLGEPFGPYGVCHRDPDGNEVDFVPGEVLGETASTADWQTVFSAMACYRTTSPTLATAAAKLADDAGFPLLIDLRPGLVTLASGKDLWEDDAFLDLAAHLQTAARELGATADLGLPRFVQLFLDAADVGAVRAFWLAALGYRPDPRAGVADIHDPRRLNPVLVFQQLDTSDTARRRQRNRFHFELALPADLAADRLAAIVAAGGRLLDESAHRRRIADPEGNEMVIVSGA